jgi:zinc and cadmium transporter
MNIALIVATTIITVFISLSGGFLLLTDSKLAKLLQKIGTALASLVLLYAALFDLIPEALDGGLDLPQVLLIALAGFAVFLIIGRLFGALHHHGDAHNLHNKRQASFMLLVDSLHTVMDGLVIGVSFLSGAGTGIMSATATAAHEIPQEIGDFAIMLRSKIPKKRIIKLQILSGLLLVPASVVAYLIGESILSALPAILALIAGFFLYIAAGELYGIIRTWKSKRP